MGWWHTKEGHLLGDGPLDIVEEALTRLADEYEKDQARLPSLDEVLACLQRTLYKRSDEFLLSGNEFLVTSVSAVQKKRPKKQQITIGDIFSVPLCDGTHAFGRVTPQSLFFEYFDLKSYEIPSLKLLLSAKIIRFPYATSLDAIEEGKWKIFNNIPFQEDEFKIQPFRFGNNIGCGDAPNKDGFIDVSSKLISLPLNELEEVPKFRIVSPSSVESQLRKHFQDSKDIVY